MKSSSNLLIRNLVCSVFFMILGMVFNPFLMPVLFRSKVGASLDGLSVVLVLFFDIIVFGLSYFFFKIRSTPLFRVLRAQWRELLMLGCTIILCFFFAEWILWKWVLKYAPVEIKADVLAYDEVGLEQRRFRPYVYLNYGLNPDFIYNSEKEHNSLGYRGNEFTLEKPEGVFRIVCLGGSTTYTGQISKWEYSYPSQLENILRSEYGYKNVEVINAGVPAYTTWETLVNFAFRVLDTNPDMIIIYHAVNDLEARMVASGAYRGDNATCRKIWEVPKIHFWQKSMILRLLNNRYKFFEFPKGHINNLIKNPACFRPNHQERQNMLADNPPVYFERNLRSIIAIAKDRNIQVVLSTFAYTTKLRNSPLEYFHRGIAEHNQVIQNLSKKYSLPLIDFKALMPEDCEYWLDVVHHNESGARLKAEIFAEFLHKNQLIPNQAGEPNEQTVNN